MPDSRTKRAEDDSRSGHLPKDLECWVVLGFVAPMVFEPESVVEISKRPCSMAKVKAVIARIVLCSCHFSVDDEWRIFHDVSALWHDVCRSLWTDLQLEDVINRETTQVSKSYSSHLLFSLDWYNTVSHRLYSEWSSLPYPHVCIWCDRSPRNAWRSLHHNNRI